MRLGPATTIVLGMFVSFAIVLAAMIVLMRPQRRAHPARQVTPAAQAPADTTVPPPAPAVSAASGAPSSEADARQDDAPSGGEDAAPAPLPDAQESGPPRGATPVPPAAGRELQRRLEQERKEMRLLKAEMEKRLRARMADREAKLDQLARNCARLSAGEAAQALAELDDETVAAVLRRMDRQTALGIAAVLQRLGREKATAF